MDALSQIFLEEGYTSTEELFRGWALLTAMARADQYRAECEHFESKYGKQREELEQESHSRRGHEDFEKEADLDDWEFAIEAVQWWELKIQELQSAPGS